MRIHSDIITRDDITAALNAATTWTRQQPGTYNHATVTATRLTEHGSRSRARAFEVLLSGSNTRRQNGGEHMAATYDEWGQFLAHLFAVDPHMTCPYYLGYGDFHTKTNRKYLDGNMTGEDTHKRKGYALHH